MSSTEPEEPPTKRARLSSSNDLVQEVATNTRKSIWLPTENWVDVLKLLSRAQLLRGVQPACRRLHAIAELPDVPNLHIVHNFQRFLDGVERNQKGATQRYEELTASKAELARHFRMSAKVEIQIGRQRRDKSQIGYQRRLENQMSVLRHSLALFRGCVLQLALRNARPDGRGGRIEVPANEYLAYLSLLAPARPFCIQVQQIPYYHHPELQADKLLREPAMLACPRLTYNSEASAEIIYHWLHHLPTEESGEMGQNSKETRIFNLKKEILPSTAVEIIKQCKKSFKQSKSVSDRRSFMLLNIQLKGWQFDDTDELPLFKLENGATGEVLQLEEHSPKSQGFAPMAMGSRWMPPEVYYRLRRCPAAELANEKKFYRETFRKDYTLEFRMPMMDNGIEAPTLTLC